MTTTVITVARQKIREQGSDRTVLFARSYAQGVRQLDRLTRQGVTRINRLLNELRTDIRGKLGQLTGGLDDPFTARIVPTIAEEINDSLTAFRTAANNELASSLSSAFDIGGGITSGALNAIGIPVAAPTISPQLLGALTGTTQDVMTEMVGQLGQRIMGQVRLAAVGLEPASAAINSIDNILRTSEAVRRGVRRRIGFGFQAEAIVRTEVGRVYSAAQQAAGEQIAESIPDLKKRWVTRSKKRKGHLAVERQTAVGGPDGPIPIKQRFRVSDFSRIGTTSFLTLGKRIQPPQGRLPGQRVVKTKLFRRRGRIITDRMLFPRDPGASAGNVVNCLLPDNEVEGEFIAGLKAWYSGPVYEIETAGGARLALTANHPVPTLKGWVSAHKVNKGDSLFKNVTQSRFPLRWVSENNCEKGPTLVQEVFDTLLSQGTARRVQVGCLDFDGDGRFMTDDIEIVGADWVLLENLEATIRKTACDPIFVGSAMGQSEMPSAGSFGSFCDRDRSSPGRFPGRRTLTLDPIAPGCFFDRFPLKTFRFGDSTSLDIFFAQDSKQRCARDAKTFGQAVQRFPGQIALDNVVNVREYDFSGHVYDFKSTSGLIRCQDVFIGNCTCVVVEFLPEIEAAVERTMGVIQRGGEPAPPPVVEKRKDIDRKGRVIEQAKDPSTDRWKKWSSALTATQRTVINNWSFNGYISMRNVQLGRFSGSAELKKKIEKKLRTLTAAVKKAPVWEGEVFRGIKNVDAKLFRRWKGSKTWRMKAFTSTSTKESVARDFMSSGLKNQVLLRIKSGTGVWLKPLSGLPGEFEVLYEKGQKFRVLKRTLTKELGTERLVLDLEEIT